MGKLCFAGKLRSLCTEEGAGMAEHFTASEVQQRYIKSMGSDLGTTFGRLYNDCAWLM